VTEPKQEEQAEDKAQASTPQIARLKNLAKATAAKAQSKQWQARKDGQQDQPEPSEVRSLTHDAEARAQAEAAMRLMAAAKPKRKPHRW
jgi:hypothetical protein